MQDDQLNATTNTNLNLSLIQIDGLISLNKHLLEIDKQYKELYDFSPSCYFTLDHEYQIQSLNLSAAQLLGYERKLLINKSFLNFLSIYSKQTFAVYIDSIFTTRKRLRYEGEIIQKGSKRCHGHIDGVYLERNLTLINVSDVTDKKLLESNYLDCKKNLFLLENLFHCSTDAIAAFDSNYNFIIFNNYFSSSFSEIFNTKLKIGMNFLYILSDFHQLQSKIKTACEKVLQGEMTSVKVENDSSNEEAYYCYELNFNRIFDPLANKLYGISLSIKNLTQYGLHKRQQIRQHIVFAKDARDHAIGEMAAALAHEINQPISAILIYSQTCIEQLKRKAKFDSQALLTGLEKISFLTKHAGEIIHKMKNFIRKGELSKEKININSLITQALTFLEHQKRDLKFQIETILEDSHPLVYVDKIKIIQVILNLSQNSIEAFESHEASSLKLVIQTKLTDNYVEIIVQDNGPGIPQEIMHKVTNSYVTTKSQGTGLGLPICRTIIEAHGGTLFIHKSDYLGTEIHFTLPILNK